MSKPSEPKKISRRSFIKDVGGGVLATSLIAPALPSAIAKSEAAKSPEIPLIPIRITVNGEALKMRIEPRTTLLELLRDKLQLTGTKLVCNHGECGSCTVLLNQRAVYSCQTLAVDADGQEVLTIEGLLSGEKLHPLQQAFRENDGLQCGFCTPGQIMAAHALLLRNPHPDLEEIKEGMSGNLCRCGAYPNIIKSVKAASENMQ